MCRSGGLGCAPPAAGRDLCSGPAWSPGRGASPAGLGSGAAAGSGRGGGAARRG